MRRLLSLIKSGLVARCHHDWDFRFNNHQGTPCDDYFLGCHGNRWPCAAIAFTNAYGVINRH